MTGSMPDLNIAIQIPTPTTTEAGRRHPPGTKRSATSTANSPIAVSSAGIDTCFVYAVAITSKAPRSSNTASVSRNTRRRVADCGVSSASAPSANAVSVDIAAPQPRAPAPPALIAR